MSVRNDIPQANGRWEAYGRWKAYGQWEAYGWWEAHGRGQICVSRDFMT